MMIQGTVYWLFGLYRGVWRFASLPDLVRIVKAAVAGTVLVVVALFIMNRTELIPRSVPGALPGPSGDSCWPVRGCCIAG
jgi:FlaA1/EpsC-like NDP-sugar epimerase